MIKLRLIHIKYSVKNSKKVKSFEVFWSKQKKEKKNKIEKARKIFNRNLKNTIGAGKSILEKKKDWSLFFLENYFYID